MEKYVKWSYRRVNARSHQISEAKRGIGPGLWLDGRPLMGRSGSQLNGVRECSWSSEGPMAQMCAAALLVALTAVAATTSKNGMNETPSLDSVKCFG